MKIPKRFKLFNHVINVKQNDKLSHNTDYWGLCKYRQLEIEIEKNTKQSLKEQTFCHELTHMILDHMNEYDLSKNEKFVEIYSQLLHQALETMEY